MHIFTTLHGIILNSINCYNFPQLASSEGTSDSNSNCRHPSTSSNCNYPSTSSNCHSRYLHQQTQKSPPSSSLVSSKLRILSTASMVKHTVNCASEACPFPRQSIEFQTRKLKNLNSCIHIYVLNDSLQV